MTRYGLTTVQKQLFDFVSAELTSGVGPPSYEEIKVHLGLRSRSNVHRLVTEVVARGWLVKLPNRARSLALPGTPAAVRREREATPPERLAGPPIQVTIPPVLAGRLRRFCEDRHRVAAEVVREALDAHLRWPA